jgi:hypothetical protein
MMLFGPLLPLLLAHTGKTMRYLAGGVLSRHYASAAEFGVYQSIWRELRAVRTSFS